MPRTVPLLLLLATACASRPPAGPPDVFDPPGARAVLRPRDEADARRISAFAASLSELYGFDPRGSLRVLRDLRDVLDDPRTSAALLAGPRVPFGTALRAATGWAFAPKEADALIRAAAGPPARALADPAVPPFLAAVREAGFLHEEAGEDFLRLRAEEADGLRELAGRPDAVREVRRAAGSAWIFHPADAAEWLAPPPGPEDIAWLVEAAGIRLRTAWLPEIRAVAESRATAESLVRAARDAEVELAGPATILVLSRLCREDPAPLDAEARERLADLAGRVAWPDAADFLFLVRLARAPGTSDTVDRLARRFRYRFDPRDADALIRLTRAGIPDPDLPEWIGRDRVPLVHPGDLLSDDPATAFVDPNDLVFLSALARLRPELVSASRGGLERTIRKRLTGRRLRHRQASPHPERADDLSGFLRPDLLKAILMLDALERPAFLAGVFALLDRDLATPDSEVGGWVVLGPDGRFRLEPFDGDSGEGNDRLLLPVRAEEAAMEFHFHATDFDDSAFAGPSSGGPGTDLDRSARHRIDGLVFTKLAGREIDCDLYTSREKVLDLGVREGP